MKIQLLLIISLFCISINAQPNRVKIKKDNLKESNYLKVDDFYLTHYLYLDLFLRENLLVDAKLEEVSNVVESIKKYVSKENPLVIEIEKEEKPNYFIVASIGEKDHDELLIFHTNWNLQLKKFDGGVNDDSYTRWYFLNHDKMTYRKDMSSEKNYSTLSNSDAANAYLFDEIKDNDNQIVESINEALKIDNLSFEENLTAQLILLKYYIFSRDEVNRNEKIDYIKSQFKNAPENLHLKGLETAFKATMFQIELMKD